MCFLSVTVTGAPWLEPTSPLKVMGHFGGGVGENKDVCFQQVMDAQVRNLHPKEGGAAGGGGGSHPSGLGTDDGSGGVWPCRTGPWAEVAPTQGQELGDPGHEHPRSLGEAVAMSKEVEDNRAVRCKGRLGLPLL